MSITLLDGAVLIIMFISALLAMFRGFSREVLSIFTWIASFFIAYFSCPYLIEYTTQYINNKSIAVGVTLFAIFLISLVLLSFFTIRLSEMIIDSRIGPIDRLLGLFYGLLRGWIISVIAFAFLSTLIALDKQPNWLRDARLNPALQSTTLWISQFLPTQPENLFSWFNEQVEQLSTPSNEVVDEADDKATSNIPDIINKNINKH